MAIAKKNAAGLTESAAEEASAAGCANSLKEKLQLKLLGSDVISTHQFDSNFMWHVIGIEIDHNIIQGRLVNKKTVIIYFIQF